MGDAMRLSDRVAAPLSTAALILAACLAGLYAWSGSDSLPARLAVTALFLLSLIYPAFFWQRPATARSVGYYHHRALGFLAEPSIIVLIYFYVSEPSVAANPLCAPVVLLAGVAEAYALGGGRLEKTPWKSAGTHRGEPALPFGL